SHAMTASDLFTTAALQQQCEQLLSRVQYLEDIEAIRRLRDQYHEYVNEDAGDRLWELFAPEGSVVYSGRPEVRGQDNIRQFFASFPVQAARQFVHSHVIQVDGDRGTGKSYLDGRPVREGKSYYVVGRFDDEYIRIDGRWLFQRVVLTLHYMVEASDRWDHLIPMKKTQSEAP
ncbi:MAG: nuclear transport factor 2 family protein, partial [Giesbergeria sp.]